jgi:hypothetical protein
MPVSEFIQELLLELIELYMSRDSPTSKVRINPTGKINVTSTAPSVRPAHRLGLLNFRCSHPCNGAKIAASKTAQKIAKKKGFRIYPKKNVTIPSIRKKINLEKPANGLSNMDRLLKDQIFLKKHGNYLAHIRHNLKQSTDIYLRGKPRLCYA